MKILKYILYPIFFTYVGVSLYFGLNITKMINRYGFISFFKFLKDWFLAGLVMFMIFLVIENIHIYLLKKKIDEQDAALREANARKS